MTTEEPTPEDTETAIDTPEAQTEDSEAEPADTSRPPGLIVGVRLGLSAQFCRASAGLLGAGFRLGNGVFCVC